jgi:hypothetical protein
VVEYVVVAQLSFVKSCEFGAEKREERKWDRLGLTLAADRLPTSPLTTHSKPCCCEIRSCNGIAASVTSVVDKPRVEKDCDIPSPISSATGSRFFTCLWHRLDGWGPTFRDADSQSGNSQRVRRLKDSSVPVDCGEGSANYWREPYGRKIYMHREIK